MEGSIGSTARLPRLLALTIAVALAGIAAGALAQAPAAPVRLLVEVRDRPPGGAPSFQYGTDNSYTVSTGGSGETQDQRAPGGVDNSTTVSTGNSVRKLVLLEGERVRVDLPAVQSLQFHVPAAGRGAPSGKTAGPGGAGSDRGGPAADGVVYYEGVAAFAARFAVRGSMVSVELVPLRSGGIAAPMIGDAGLHALVLQGRVGEWIALGDTDVVSGGRSLSPTAEPPSPAGVWVRVARAPAAAQGDGP